MEIFSSIFLPIVIIGIMFGMGLSVSSNDIGYLQKSPKIVVAGVIAQMASLPIVAFVISFLFPIPAYLKIGLVLIACCPGGTMSNLVTYWLRGNIALCIALTAITSFLILITLPLIMNLALMVFAGHAESIRLPVGKTIINVFLTTLLPSIAGFVVKNYWPAIAKKIEKPLEIFMTGALFLIYLIIVLNNRNKPANATGGYEMIVLITFLLNVISMAIGFAFSRFLGVDNRDSYTISIQVGLQNSALAIFIATSLMHMPESAVVAVVYGSFTLFTTRLFAYLMKRYL